MTLVQVHVCVCILHGWHASQKLPAGMVQFEVWHTWAYNMDNVSGIAYVDVCLCCNKV